FLDSIVNQRLILFGVRLANVGRQRVRVPHLLVDVGLVVVGAHFSVAAIGERPVNHSNGIIRRRILRPQGNVLLVVGLGFLELLLVKRLPGHLVKDGSQSIDRADVVRGLLENALVLRYGLLTVAHVFRG